jgi:hypothetical protein
MWCFAPKNARHFKNSDAGFRPAGGLRPQKWTSRFAACSFQLRPDVLASQCYSAYTSFPEITSFTFQSDTSGVRCVKQNRWPGSTRAQVKSPDQAPLLWKTPCTGLTSNPRSGSCPSPLPCLVVILLIIKLTFYSESSIDSNPAACRRSTSESRSSSSSSANPSNLGYSAVLSAMFRAAYCVIWPKFVHPRSSKDKSHWCCLWNPVFTREAGAFPDSPSRWSDSVMQPILKDDQTRSDSMPGRWRVPNRSRFVLSSSMVVRGRLSPVTERGFWINPWEATAGIILSIGLVHRKSQICSSKNLVCRYVKATEKESRLIQRSGESFICGEFAVLHTRIEISAGSTTIKNLWGSLNRWIRTATIS